MMMHAYNELYVNDAKENLSTFFDYAINDCGFSPEILSCMFVDSGYAKLFETGNPSILSGMSGIELARFVILKMCHESKELPEATFKEECTKEYWTGWALAEYQWYTSRRFEDIFRNISLSKIINMYPVYHEMDISTFINDMEEIYLKKESNLKRLRQCNNLSQSELAKKSGVNLRNIQMYEQGVNNIDKAQAQTLYKLAKVLYCSIEDLLESPMR